MQSAIGVERQLPHTTTVAVTYTNNRSDHLTQTVPINAPYPGTYNDLLPGPGNGAISVRLVGSQPHVARYRRRRMRRRCARTSISNTSESSASDIIVAGFPQIGQSNDSSGTTMSLPRRADGNSRADRGRHDRAARRFLRGRRDLFWIEQIIGAVATSGLL